MCIIRFLASSNQETTSFTAYTHTDRWILTVSLSRCLLSLRCTSSHQKGIGECEMEHCNCDVLPPETIFNDMHTTLSLDTQSVQETLSRGLTNGTI